MKKSTNDLFESLKKQRNIEDFLKENQSELIFDSTSEMISFYMKQKGLMREDVVRRSMLGNYAYYIINGKKQNPSRDKMIMLCFGLELTPEEANRLLKMAGVGDLYPRNPRDAIIINALNFKLSVIEANNALEELGEDELPLPS